MMVLNTILVLSAAHLSDPELLVQFESEFVQTFAEGNPAGFLEMFNGFACLSLERIELGQGLMARHGGFCVALLEILALQANQIAFKTTDGLRDGSLLEIAYDLKVLIPIGRFVQTLKEILSFITTRDLRHEVLVLRRDLHRRGSIGQAPARLSDGHQGYSDFGDDEDERQQDHAISEGDANPDISRFVEQRIFIDLKRKFPGGSCSLVARHWRLGGSELARYCLSSRFVIQMLPVISPRLNTILSGATEISIRP